MRFSLIPYIPGIDYKPDPNVPSWDEWGSLTDHGLLLLNKDNENYLYVRVGCPKLMKKTKKQLKRDFQGIKKLKNKSPLHELHFYMYQCEIERREKVKKAKKKRWFHGNN